MALSHSRLLCMLLPSLMLVPLTVHAGDHKILFKDGFQVIGEFEMKDQRLAIKSGPRIVHASVKQVLAPQEGAGLDLPEIMRIAQPTTKRESWVAFTRPIRTTPFDQHGRRSQIMVDPKGREVSILQGIVELRPTYAVVKSLGIGIESNVWLNQIPSEALVAILKRATDNKPPQMLKQAVRLCIQGERFIEAKQLLDLLVEKIGEAEESSAGLREKLNLAINTKMLAKLERSRALGQHAVADQLTTALASQELPGELATRYASITQKHKDDEARLQSAKKALALLDNVDLPPDQAQSIKPILSQVQADISLVNLDRIASYLKLQDQPQVDTKEEIGLLVSGWLLGDPMAIKDIKQANQYAKAVLQMQAIYGAESKEQRDAELLKLKSLALLPDVLAQLIRQQPAFDSTTKPGENAAIEFESQGNKLNYVVRLPDGYSRYRDTPALICLPGNEISAERLVDYWKQQANDRGYIVLSPNYRADTKRPYEYSAAEHQAFLDFLADARKRFAVDADRVFLSGHEMGAMQAWDLGMAHPDEFAGLLPFCGTPRFYCQHYSANLGHLPVYAVEGALHGDNLAFTSGQMKNWFADGHSCLLIEYPNAGREIFAGEFASAFEWMDRQKRPTAPRSYHVQSARSCDKRFYWTEIIDHRPNAMVAPGVFGKVKFNPARITAQANDANRITITAGGMVGLKILLPYQLVQLDAADLSVEVNNKVIHKGAIFPDIEATLKHVRQTGDRKRLVAFEITIPKV